MSSFINLIETFEIPTLTTYTYREKIDGLLNRFPRLNSSERNRIALPQKYPKTADDYVSMKFCIMGRFPVYGIYNRSDMELIALCVEKVLYAIDDCDCDLDPNLVPDLTFRRLNLGIRYSSLAASQTLSYTKKTMCSAISTLSLGYTTGKEDEWADAFVLLSGITTQAIRFTTMHFHVLSAFRQLGDAEHIPHASCLSILPKWRQASKAIREGKLPYLYKYYDEYDGKICNTGISRFCFSNSIQLIDYGDKTKGKGFYTTNDDSNGQREGNRSKSKYEKITGITALVLGATQKLGFVKTKSPEAAFPGMSYVTRRTLTAAVLGAMQKREGSKIKSKYEKITGTTSLVVGATQKLGFDKTKSLESCGTSEATSEAAFLGISDVTGRTLAAAVLNVVSSARIPTKVKPTIIVVAKCLHSKKP